MAKSRIVKDFQGEPLTIADLPPAGTDRWTASKKANVLIAITNGILSLEEAERRYGLSTQEFLSWKAEYQVHGLPGLKARNVRRL